MKLTDIKRQNIIDAAVEEFSSHGFAGARTVRIAKAANVSSRTLYKHFPTKEALFDEIIRIIADETGAIKSDPYEPSSNLREQLVRALCAYIEAITDTRYMKLNRIIMSEYLRDNRLAHRVFANAAMETNPVRDIVQGAMEDGRLKKVDLQYATDMLSGPAIRIFFWPQFLANAEVPHNPQDVFEDCVDMFMVKFRSNSGN